jgi:two-component system heavy metal sensor histidine kinase CusS
MLRRREPLSISLRLALLFAAIAAAAFVGVGAYLYQTLSRQMVQRDDMDLLNKAVMLRHVLAEQGSLAALRAQPEMALNAVYGQDIRLRITAPDGSVLAQNSAALPAAVPGVPSAREPAMADIRNWHSGSGMARVLTVLATLNAGEPPVSVTLLRERSDRLAIIRRYAIDLLGALLAGAALVAALGFLIVRKGMRPLYAVIGKANDISAHRLQSRLAVNEVPAELRELGVAFNAMLDRLEEGVQRLSGFAADLAHDMRTPVNTLMVQTQVALSRPRTVEEYQALMASNLEEYERLARMIENTLFLARADNAQLGLQREPLDVRAELERIGEYFEGLADDGGVALLLELPPEARLQADAVLFQRAVNNLVSNAIRHTPRGGRVTLAVHSTGEELAVSVRNTGEGIAAEHLSHIFDRYYRADPARPASSSSAGLGLSIVRAIMSLHGGSVTAASLPGETCFTLHFPRNG